MEEEEDVENARVEKRKEEEEKRHVQRKSVEDAVK